MTTLTLEIAVEPLVCSMSGMYAVYAVGHHDPAAFLGAAFDAYPEIAEMGEWTPNHVEQHWYRWVRPAPGSEFCKMAVRCRPASRGAWPVTELIVD